MDISRSWGGFFITAFASMAILAGCTTTEFLSADFEAYAEGETPRGLLRGAPAGDRFILDGDPADAFVTDRLASEGKRLEFRTPQAEAGQTISFVPATGSLPDGSFVYLFDITGTGDITAFLQSNDLLIRVTGPAAGSSSRQISVNGRALAEAPDGLPISVLVTIVPDGTSATVLARGRSVEVVIGDGLPLPSPLWFRNDGGIFFIDNVKGLVSTPD